MHRNDLPSDIAFKGDIAVDTETLGLHIKRDRLCLVQLSDGSGDAHLVQFDGTNYKAPTLKKLLGDSKRTLIFHFARFDVAVLRHYLEVDIRAIYCTRIASYLARTYTDKHGLKELCAELLEIEISKQQQSSNWAAGVLSEAQLQYAASDVLYLHRLREKLNAMLAHTDRAALAGACFNFIPTRCTLDLEGWENMDIFAH